MLLSAPRDDGWGVEFLKRTRTQYRSKKRAEHDEHGTDWWWFNSRPIRRRSNPFRRQETCICLCWDRARLQEKISKRDRRKEKLEKFRAGFRQKSAFWGERKKIYSGGLDKISSKLRESNVSPSATLQTIHYCIIMRPFCPGFVGGFANLSPTAASPPSNEQTITQLEQQ